MWEPGTITGMEVLEGIKNFLGGGHLAVCGLFR